MQLLSNATKITFESLLLCKDAAEIAEKHLKYIARKYHCHILTESRHDTQAYIIPKALSSNSPILHSVKKQSDDILSSPDIFNRMSVAKGSIDIRTGDIALQQVS